MAVETVECARCHVGLVIGRRGWTVNQIEKETNVKVCGKEHVAVDFEELNGLLFMQINIDQHARFCVIHISGRRACVQDALKAVKATKHHMVAALSSSTVSSRHKRPSVCLEANMFISFRLLRLKPAVWDKVESLH
jgi:hypothetical protein